MNQRFDIQRFARLKGLGVDKVEAVLYETPSAEPMFDINWLIKFSDGTILSLQFWRLLKDGKSPFSSFDHGRRYGLPAPIDALDRLREELQGQTTTQVSLDRRTGDLLFDFAGGQRLEVFNFTGFEIWQLQFPDGSAVYSNYVLAT